MAFGLILDAVIGLYAPEVGDGFGVALMSIGVILCTLIDTDFNHMCHQWTTITSVVWVGLAGAAALAVGRDPEYFPMLMPPLYFFYYRPQLLGLVNRSIHNKDSKAKAKSPLFMVTDLVCLFIIAENVGMIQGTFRHCWYPHFMSDPSAPSTNSASANQQCEQFLVAALAYDSKDTDSSGEKIQGQELWSKLLRATLVSGGLATLQVVMVLYVQLRGAASLSRNRPCNYGVVRSREAMLSGVCGLK
jgi:hypothetical protein